MKVTINLEIPDGIKLKDFQDYETWIRYEVSGFNIQRGYTSNRSLKNMVEVAVSWAGDILRDHNRRYLIVIDQGFISWDVPKEATITITIKPVGQEGVMKMIKKTVTAQTYRRHREHHLSQAISDKLLKGEQL